MRSRILVPLSLAAAACQGPSPTDAGRAPLSFGGSRWEYLAATYDGNGDSRIDPEEYGRGEGAFANLDADQDGTITAADFPAGRGNTSELLAQAIFHSCFHSDEDREVLSPGEPEETLRAFDDDGDGALDREEFEYMRSEKDIPPYSNVMTLMIGARPEFDLLRDAIDQDGDQKLSAAELADYHENTYDPSIAQVARGFSEEELARRSSGPAPGEPAPDFCLSPPDGGASVRLSSFAGRRPVALIFGSYT